MTTWTTKLAPMLRDRIRREHDKAPDRKHQSGGFQNHVRRIAENIDAEGRLTLTDELIGETYRQAYTYGKGTWNTLCQQILSAIAFDLTRTDKP